MTQLICMVKDNLNILKNKIIYTEYILNEYVYLNILNKNILQKCKEDHILIDYRLYL